MSNEEGKTPREIAIVDDSMRRENDIEESKEVTEFADQSHEIQVVVPAKVEEVPNPYVYQGLKEFLERPVPVLTFTWALASAYGTCIQRLVFPDVLFNLPFFWEKLRHFQYIRGGLHFRVKINATLYHYGKLLMVWRPMSLGKTTPGYGTTARAGAYDNIHTLSSYPSIQVTPNSSETQEMRVSYFLPVSWINLLAYGSARGANAGTRSKQRNLMNMGVLEFWVLTPLQASGAAGDPPATVSVYANFENVELSGYTPMQITYENQSIVNLTNLIMPNGFNFDNVVLPIAQSGRITSNTAHANKGIWKTTLMPMQIASSEVDLPMIPLGVKQIAGNNLQIEGMPSLAQYLAVPTYLARLQVKSSTASGALLARIPVTPMLMPMNGTTKFPTRLSFIASLFALWKGELEYHFQVVCSKFHSFRFRVYWTPWADATSSVAYVANTVNKVVDVQGETNFSVVVPWLHYQPVLRTNTNVDSVNGFLMVDLLNPLVYPTTPIPLVTINIWVSAKRLDLEKMEYWANNVTAKNVLVPIDPPQQVQSIERKKRTLESKEKQKDLPLLQSGAFDPESQGTKKPIRGQEMLPSDLMKIVGEKILDFPDIITKSSTVAQIPNNQRLWYTPLSLPVSTAQRSKLVNSILEYLQLTFIGFSGSLEFWIPQKCDIYCIPWTHSGYAYDIKATTTDIMTMLQTQSPMNIAYFQSVGDGSMTHRAVALPFYTTMMFKPLTLIENAYSGDDAMSYPGIDIHVRNAQDTNVYVLMRGGGDFKFHFAVGPPMLQS